MYLDWILYLDKTKTKNTHTHKTPQKKHPYNFLRINHVQGKSRLLELKAKKNASNTWDANMRKGWGEALERKEEPKRVRACVCSSKRGRERERGGAVERSEPGVSGSTEPRWQWRMERSPSARRALTAASKGEPTRSFPFGATAQKETGRN